MRDIMSMTNEEKEKKKLKKNWNKVQAIEKSSTRVETIEEKKNWHGHYCQLGHHHGNEYHEGNKKVENAGQGILDMRCRKKKVFKPLHRDFVVVDMACMVEGI